jgi:lipoprotein-anchoring transpeptidase ErfK/SrfK
MLVATKGVPAMKTRALGAIAALGGMILLGGLSACGTADAATWHGKGSTGATTTDKAAAAAATITAPANGATNVSTAVELALAGTDTKAADVTVTDASGAKVDGAVRADGTTWVPATQLQYGTAYTAEVKGSGKVAFTTMAKPAKTVSTTVSMKDGAVYGVGMPIVVRFGSSIPKDQRASVERRLLVTSTPAQVGSWNWFDGTEVHYRPKEYWQPGTELNVRLATGGLPLAKGFGVKDVTVHATIGDSIIMTTDNATHQMTVTKNGEVIKTIPVSLGKPKNPSSSGSMVIMTKNQSERFVSTVPGDSYDETVYWTMRLTSSGQYIHAAPWSVGDQGKRNVSHGCTNVSTANAKYLYGLTHIGDPVIVKGTPRKLDWGNGWTDWDRTWDEYLKGSALSKAPVEEAPAWTGKMDQPG